MMRISDCSPTSHFAVNSVSMIQNCLSDSWLCCFWEKKLYLSIVLFRGRKNVWSHLCFTYVTLADDSVMVKRDILVYQCFLSRLIFCRWSDQLRYRYSLFVVYRHFEKISSVFPFCFRWPFGAIPIGWQSR